MRAPSGYHWSQQTSVAMRPRFRVEVPEPGVARREVEFLEIQRIVRNVHLPVDPQQRAVGIDHRRSIVIEPLRALLEQRRHENHAVFFGHLGQALRATARGLVSARSNSRASSSRQKYCERKSS